jgi:predicted DNA-binding protein
MKIIRHKIRSLRVTQELDQQLINCSKSVGVTPSHFIRLCIAQGTERLNGNKQLAETLRHQFAMA